MKDRQPFYIPADEQGFTGVSLDSVYYKPGSSIVMPARIEYPAWNIQYPLPERDSVHLGRHLEITRAPFLVPGVIAEYIPQYKPKDNHVADMYGIREQSNSSSFTEKSSYVARLSPTFMVTPEEEKELARLYEMELPSVRDRRIERFRSQLLPAVFYDSENGFRLEKQPFSFTVSQDFDVAHNFGNGTLDALDTSMEWADENGTQYRGSVDSKGIFFEFGVGKESLVVSQKEVNWYAGVHIDLKSLGTLDSRMRASVAQRIWNPDDFYRTITPTLTPEITDINS